MTRRAPAILRAGGGAVRERPRPASIPRIGGDHGPPPDPRVPRSAGIVVGTFVAVVLASLGGGAIAQAQTDETPDAPTPPTTIAVTSGSGWSRGPDLAPGTTIELAGPGVHRSAVLEGVRGTEDAPIVVRRDAGGGAVPFVVGGEIGLLLRDCEHVVVEEIAFIGATRSAIRIEASRAIAIRNVLVARLGPDADADGIEILDSSGIELATVRFDGWQDAGLELVDARDVRGNDLQFTPLVRHRCHTAIRVGEGCRDVRLADVSTLAIPVAVEIGVATGSVESPEAPESMETPGDRTTAPSAGPANSTSRPRGIVFERARLDRPDVALRLLDAVEVDLRRLTIVDPEVVLEIDAEVLEAARFADNLVVWNPGAMSAFAKVVRGDEGLELGRNLWWSVELPEARPLLGDLPGRIAVPQRFSPDPRVTPRGHPTASEAEGFGRPAPDRP